MVASVGDRHQVQTRAVLGPALLAPAKSSLDERLTNSLGCPLNLWNSQVIRRIRHEPERGGPADSSITGRRDAACWVIAPQPAGNPYPPTAAFAARVRKALRKRTDGTPQPRVRILLGMAAGARLESAARRRRVGTQRTSGDLPATSRRPPGDRSLGWAGPLAGLRGRPYAASSMARMAVSGWLIGSTPTRLTMDVMVPSASASTHAARCSNPR
jgi:hypothetical protein